MQLNTQQAAEVANYLGDEVATVTGTQYVTWIDHIYQLTTVDEANSKDIVEAMEGANAALDNAVMYAETRNSDSGKVTFHLLTRFPDVVLALKATIDTSTHQLQMMLGEIKNFDEVFSDHDPFTEPELAEISVLAGKMLVAQMYAQQDKGNFPQSS